MTLIKKLKDKKVNFEFNKEYIRVVNEKIQNNDALFITNAFKEIHPADAADIIENLNENDREKLIKLNSFKIDPEVSTEDVVESMKSIASDANMLQVGDSKMQVKGSIKDGGKRYIRILHYCSPSIAQQFIDYTEAFGAFMPCRILIVEDENGDRWLITMAMELMLFGGHTLPPEMMKKAEHVRSTMYKMMDLGAKGDF